VLFCIFSFFILQSGLYLDKLHISNISLNKISIRADDTLHFMIEDVQIMPSKKSQKKISLQEVNDFLKIISNFKSFIGSFVVNKIEMPQLQASVNYSLEKGGNLALKYNNDIDAKIAFAIEKENYTIFIQSLHYQKFKTDIKGEMVIDTSKMKLFAKLNALINHDANLTLYTVADSKKIFYNIIATDKIKNVKNILNMIPFNNSVKYWANDAIQAKSLQLSSLYGYIDFNNLKNSYKHIYVNAAVNQLQYKYNPKLAPIDSKKTLLEFKDGILFIRPLQAYTYNTYLKNSWLKIDFTKKDELLDLYLKLDGKLNDDILYLLSAYKIKLPIKQNSGIVKSDLHINIDLRTIETDVVGDFWTKKANMDFIGLNINIYNTHVHLQNSDITIDKMRAQYKNILDTNVSMRYNAKSAIGKIDFYANSVAFKGLKLDTNTTKPFHVVYNLDKKKKVLHLDSSHWLYKNHKLLLEKFSMPFYTEKKEVIIPPVMLRLENIATAFVNGNIDLKKFAMQFGIDLFKLHYNGLNLAQTDAYFQVNYKQQLKINAADTIYFKLNGSEYKIHNFQLVTDTNGMKINKSLVEIGKYITATVYAKHTVGSDIFNIGVNDFILKSPHTKETLYKNDKIKMQAFFTDKNISIKSPQLNAHFFSDQNGWELKLFSLDKVAQNSNILKFLNISKGSVKLFKKSAETQTKFQGNLFYPSALLMNKNKEVHQYKIKGEIDKNKNIYLRVNKKIKIKIDKAIEIYPQKSSLNLDAILRLIEKIKKLKKSKTQSKQKLKVYLNATDSSLYLGKNRYAISDKIYMQYVNKILTAQLLYKNGQAGFKMENDKFYLYGKNFNDRFMEKISAFSKFKGGRLDFSMQGKIDDYSGVFFMSDATIVEYKLLNNVLAFINTVPSLVTFSLPNYNKNGLYVENGYMNFTSKKNLFHISDFYLHSKELTILGKGIADVNKDKIDLLMNLKTDLASKISKIPLVGYIIFDGKSLSTTLKITGKLSNPTVQTQIAKDIVVAPLNIIKRTLTLPYKLIKKAVEDTNSTR